MEGKIGHRRVERPGAPLPEAGPGAATRQGGDAAPQAPAAGEAVAEKDEESPETIHARSVWLTSERLAITGKVDLVEAKGSAPTPVDYKRGKRPLTAGGAWNPERVQLCAQGLLLWEYGCATETRIHQFHPAADSDLRLKLARRLVGMRQDARVALGAESRAQLLGIEGTAAASGFPCPSPMSLSNSPATPSRPPGPWLMKIATASIRICFAIPRAKSR